jgi:hypothetical protein
LASRHSRRLKLPETVGLLLFGVILGPHVLGMFGENRPIADFFAELGQLLLMFSAGLEIDVDLFRKARTSGRSAPTPMRRPTATGLLQPFVNYNFEGGLYLVSSPIITMSWLAPVNQQLTLPVGGGVGKIFHLGKLPVNAQLSAYYNVVRPDFGPDWQLRAQVQFMFPK